MLGGSLMFSQHMRIFRRTEERDLQRTYTYHLDSTVHIFLSLDFSVWFCQAFVLRVGNTTFLVIECGRERVERTTCSDLGLVFRSACLRSCPVWSDPVFWGGQVLEKAWKCASCACPCLCPPQSGLLTLPA